MKRLDVCEHRFVAATWAESDRQKRSDPSSRSCHNSCQAQGRLRMVDDAEIRSNDRGLAKLAGGPDEARRRLVGGGLESRTETQRWGP